MTSLNFSDFMLSLTKNRKGRMELLRSTRFDVTLHIANAIGNNINNRGVVMKYLYALLNLKATDRYFITTPRLLILFPIAFAICNVTSNRVERSNSSLPFVFLVKESMKSLKLSEVM